MFSSRIINSSTSAEVLVQSPYCSLWQQATPAPEETEKTAALAEELVKQWVQNNLEIERCYNSTSTPDCSPFGGGPITWDTDWEAECPFDDSMCIGPAMRMGTGLMGPLETIRLNLEPEDWLSLRKITTCTPIIQDKYTTTIEAIDSGVPFQMHGPLPGEQYVVYEYGSDPTAGTGDLKNRTFGVSNFTAASFSTRTLLYVWSKIPPL